MNISNFSNLSDAALFELCRDYGARALEWRRKFIGLLPEVNRRRLFETRGFSSIFEFAAKLCGLSEEQVRLTLNLEKRFEDKPCLMALLVSGEESINKLARVVSIATPENQAELAEKIMVLPKSALETWIRDEKSLPGQTSMQQNFNDASLRLSEETKARLLELQQKGIDINAMILEMLYKREVEIQEEKEKIAEEINLAPSRYIPARIRKVLKEEHGEKCSISTCKRPSEEIHHTQRYALGRNHNPKFLAPLCKEHHVIAHSVDIKYHEAKGGWRVSKKASKILSGDL